MNRETDTNGKNLDIRKLLGIGLMIIAICTMIAGVTEYITYEMRIRGKDKAEATAVKVDKSATLAGKSSKNNVWIKFRVNRVFYDGIAITVNRKDLKGGDTFNIYYKRENPFDAMEIVVEKEGMSFEGYIIGGIILAVIAIILIKKGNLSMRIEENKKAIPVVDEFDEFMKDIEMPKRKTADR